MSYKPEYFGKFILLDKLASGGMAEVFLAKTLGAENVAKFVAVKRILPQYSKSQEFIEMFKEEAKIAVNLAHSNIVSIFEFGELHRQFYLAMEYVEGRNLRQILNRLKELNKSFSQDQALYVINEAARGLDHAHRCIDGNTGRPLNIIHRDISPQNVMINFEGNVKIVDFGIAKAEIQMEPTRAGTLKGKFSYMSPEQSEGMDIDARTDIFSLGIVLWELLSNERLFLSNNEVNTLRKIKECHVPSLHKLDPTIPVELEKIVNKALARDRNLRYQSASDLHKDLNSFLNRQFPDFSPQDFSMSFRQLFAEELLQSRKKLIEYAKLNFDVVDEKTFAIDTITKSKTNTSVTDPTKPEDIDYQSTEAQRRQLEALKSPVTRLRSDKFETSKSVNRTISRKIDATGTPSAYYERSSSRGHPYQNTDTTLDRESKMSLIPTIFIILLFAGWGIYYLRDNPDTSTWLFCKVIDGPNCSSQSLESVKPPPPEPAKINQVSVMIESQPPGAEILINGSSLGFTPSEVMIPQDSAILVTLKKDGYLSLTKTIRSTKSGDSFNWPLVKTKVGYLSIRVIPGNAIIYINDQKLSEAPPIDRYLVPVSEIKVKAYDPLTGAVDEQRVKVKEDTLHMVTLFLKKTNRQVASPKGK